MSSSLVPTCSVSELRSFGCPRREPARKKVETSIIFIVVILIIVILMIAILIKSNINNGNIISTRNIEK